MLQYYLSGLKKIFSITKKVFIIFIVFFAVIALFSYFINKDKVSLAPTPNINPIEKNRAEIYNVINDKRINSTKQGKTTIAIYRSMMCGMIGEACTNNPKDGDKNFNNSVFGFVSKLIVLPYTNPPASGAYWAYNGLQSAGFIDKSYAAEGIGFSAIKPFSNLWKIFRDVAYMLLVIVLIAIGFMIMFRAKLNPQTVITVENSLPKIVIALILITFSFAIAGFMIDLMYIVIALIISIISGNNAFYNTSQVQNEYLNASMWKIGGSMFLAKDNKFFIGGFSFLMDTGAALFSIVGPTFGGIVRTVLGGLGGYLTWSQLIKKVDFLSTGLNSIGAATVDIGNLPQIIIGAIVSGLLIMTGASLGAFFVPQFIIGLLILITIIFLFFRIFLMLFKAYLQTTLLIILSPFLLLFEAIPGKNAFSYWFKSLLGEIITFPTVIAIFMIGYVLTNTLVSAHNIWTPPFLVGLDPQAFSFLIGIGLVFLIPDLVKALKDALGIKPLPVSLGLGTFFAGTATAVGAGIGTLGQFGSISLGLSAFGLTQPFAGLAKGVSGWFNKSKIDAATDARLNEQKR